MYFKVNRVDTRVLFYEFNLANPALYGVAISLAFVVAFLYEYLSYLQNWIDVRHSTACRSILSSDRSKRNKLTGRIGIMIARRIIGFLALVLLLSMDVGVVMGVLVGGVAGYSIFTWWAEARGENRGRVANKPSDLEAEGIYKKYEEPEELNVQRYPISTREYPPNLPPAPMPPAPMPPAPMRQDNRDLEY